jgi:hypothetical protein
VFGDGLAHGVGDADPRRVSERVANQETRIRASFVVLTGRRMTTFCRDVVRAAVSTCRSGPRTILARLVTVASSAARVVSEQGHEHLGIRASPAS